MKKSKQITLTILSGMALTVTSCGEEKKKENPYEEYAYYGKANEPGMVYSHYGSGILTWYLMSRMFHSYSYGAMGPGAYYRSSPGYFTRQTSAAGGYSSVAKRGGFGKIGYARSARS